MHIYNILGIAVALAMDAFAVSIASGIRLKKVSFRQTFRLSWHFGFFQAIMPVMGWLMGTKIHTWIKGYDHWVAFGLLAFCGGKMLMEAFEHDEEKTTLKKDPTKGATLIMLSVATSIDAFAVGFSISVLNVSIAYPAVVIGLIAAMFTIIGLHAGKKVGMHSKISNYAESLGGVILLCIGVNILYEHGSLTFLL
jgi:putative Mn2+ efflux pump MntP